MAQVFLGVGLYSVNQAAQLLKREPSRLRRWLVGKRYRAADGTEKWSPPLLSSQIGIIDGQLVLSFRDLMELRALDRFLAAGLSVRLLRRAMIMAREAFKDDRPLSNRRFGTDGRTLFAGGDGMMLDLVSGQYAPIPLIAPSLASDCEFDASEMPLRWWPLGRESGILIDPTRAFGQPLLDRLGIPVSVLTSKSADCYGATSDELQAASAFEAWLAT